MEFNKSKVLELTGNISENVKRFKHEIQIYFLATETNKKSKEIQVARLLNWLKKYLKRLKNTAFLDEMKLSKIFIFLRESNGRVKHFISSVQIYVSWLKYTIWPLRRKFIKITNCIGHH